MNFALDISRFGEKAMENVGLVLRKVTLDLTRAIIMDTPVRWGILRGDWQPAINSFAQGTLGEKDTSGNKAVARVMGMLKDIKPGDTVTFVNNQPYAQRIEHGGSPVKAPEGMLERNLVRYPGVVRTAAQEVRR